MPPKDNKRKYGHHRGRSELRKIQRTSRRGKSVENFSRSDEVVDKNSSNETQVNDDLDRLTPESAPSDKIKAYDALMTLLKSDITSDSESKEPTKALPISGNDESEILEEMLDEDNDNNSDSISDDSDLSDEEIDQEDKDPFEYHHNVVSTEYLTSNESKVTSKNFWKIQNKENLTSINYLFSYLIPDISANGPNLNPRKSIQDFNIKSRIMTPYIEKYSSKLTEQDSYLAAGIFNYSDVLFPCKSFNNNSYRKLYVTHALNHIYKTRDRILKNNEKLKKFREEEKRGLNEGQLEPELKDQGFTRPKVLILLPTSNSADEIVDLLVYLSGTDQQENKKRFKTKFHAEVTPPESKPDDFREEFKGNSNDYFCLGVKFTRKTMKLFSSFYSSDMIIASPLGLSMILENPDKKKRQYDFLSSIEIVILDRANHLEMQNWDHVSTIYKYLNKIPKSYHDADFSRIRMTYINEQAKYFTQNLVFCEYLTPSCSNIVNKKSKNLGGKLKFKPVFNSETCMMNSVGLSIPQYYKRFVCDDPSSVAESRFKFFVNTVLPSLSRATSYDDGILVYIPSYFDYLRIRNYMKDNTKHVFGCIDEYSSQSKLSKNRHAFNNGKIKILLYSERLHYFRRLDLSGVKSVIMYELPTNPIFYKEILRYIGKSVFKNVVDLHLSSVTVMYSKWDVLPLERIVGDSRVPLLCKSDQETFQFK